MAYDFVPLTIYKGIMKLYSIHTWRKADWSKHFATICFYN